MTATVQIKTPPVVVGYYLIGGPDNAMRISLTRRPRWLARVLMAWLLDWVWHDGV